MAGGEFVEGWLVAQLLGEGTYGEVRLLVHARTGASVALKSVRAEPAAGAREAALHRALRHPHVLRCLGERTHLGIHYMFLEYAQGGELFDRIEPDVGMSEHCARRYWRQLLLGLEYLHGRGVAHRDVKPENLLLDNNDNIKISDFGMATLFRHEGRERLLSRVCGTVPYAAPEVLAAASRPYRAPPADLWAAAVVLLAMLAGELPWERAHESDTRFASWARAGAGAGADGPWGKLSAGALALVSRTLRPTAARRPPLRDLLHNRWLNKDEQDVTDGVGARAWSSQPARGAAHASTAADELSAADMDALLSCSQPAHADDLLLATQHEACAAEAGVLQRLARRVTRVWVRGDEAGALRAVADALAARGYCARIVHARLLYAECGPELRMRVYAMRARGGAGGGAGPVLLEFRRWRGCGLQFKRRFIEMRDALRPIAVDAPTATGEYVLRMDTDHENAMMH